jgi:hypothetical protein
MKNLLNLSFVLAIFTSLVFTSCSADKASNIASQAANVNTNTKTNRTVEVVAAANAIATEYSYKTLAAFKNGVSTMDLATVATLQNEKVSLVVLYDSGAKWATNFNAGDFSKTGDDVFNGLMESYELAITKHFELDEFNEGIVLEAAKGQVSDPVAAAREISMVEGVFMVEVKQAPKEVVKGETVSTGK